MAIWDKGRERKWDLMRVRQPGTTSEHDSRQIVTETFRRLKPDEAEPEQKSVFATPAKKPIAPPPPPPADIIDRFHKKADTYITVANPHVLDSDPIRLPGAYEFVQEAIDYGESLVAAGLAGRVAVVIHGGQYTEDLTLTSGQVDLYGLGRPKITGTLTCATTNNNFLVQGLELYGGDTYAVDLPALVAPVSGEVYGPVFNDCWIHSTGIALRTLGRIVCMDSRIAVDYLAGYANIDNAALQVYMGTHDMWSEFYRCRIEGAPDRRVRADNVGFPNKGRAWHAIAKVTTIDPIYTPYGDSGLMMRKCTIVGYGWNEGWQVYHDTCHCYGGKKSLETVGEVYMFATGRSVEAADQLAAQWFDHTGVACRYLVQEGDSGAGFAYSSATYLQHFKQLRNDFDWAGSMIVPAPTIFGGYGNAPVLQGQVYGEHSITWREYFEASGAPAEIAILCNCDSELGHYANNGFVFGTGVLGTILANPYQL